MTASRDIQVSRPRASMTLTPASLPSRNSYSSRNFSTSVTLGSMNSANRVSRRKSSVATPMSSSALAAIRNQAAQRVSSDSARLTTSADRKSPDNSSEAVEDGPALGKVTKNRNRRTSELPKLSKERSKSVAGELRCDVCGKGYKHGSCLTKHKWEHTPEWQLTSKLLISKHQQVQLLEAASSLMNIKHAAVVNVVEESDSASPAASGSSDAVDESDDDRSSRTSTPEQIEHVKPDSLGNRLRSDSYNSAVVGSYQSTLATSLAPSSIPTYGGFNMARQWSSGSRPSVSQQGTSDDESADLTAAARGLQLIGTPQTMPVVPENEVPEDIDMEEEDEDEDDDGVFGMEQ